MKIINPGFFYRNYEAYVISNPLINAVVQRKQSDFNELRQSLVRMYPGTVVPPMPTLPIQRLEPEFMNARRAQLQAFINKLLAHPLLKTSKMVWEFFSVEDNNKYEELKQENAKLVTPKEVPELFTREGNANVAFNVFLMQSCQDIQLGLEEISNEFNK